MLMVIWDDAVFMSVYMQELICRLVSKIMCYAVLVQIILELIMKVSGFSTELIR